MPSPRFRMSRGARPLGRFARRLAFGLACGAVVLPQADRGRRAAPATRPGRVLPPCARTGRVAAFVLQEPDDPRVVTVTGTAEVEAQPDRARIFFAVETEGETAREAGEENARVMTAVSEALVSEGAGAAGLRVETFGYSLTPRYGPVRADQSREILGYTARNTVQVRVDEVARVGPLIDAALESGANRVANLQFELQDAEPFRHEAVRLAVQRARSEAEVIAEALGVPLGPALDVQGGADTFYPRQAFAGMERAVAMMDSTPIEAGMQTVTARVTIRFRLDEEP
jgi:uncharacterized protein